MHRIVKNGSTSNILRVTLRNSTTGLPLTGLSSASSGLIISTIASTEASATAYTQAGSTIETIATLGTYASPTATKCRFKEIDSTNHPGDYEVQIADARYAVSSARALRVTFSGAASLATTTAIIQLTSVDVDDGVHFGITALPNAAAAASGGLIINGSNSGTVTLASWVVSGTTTFTGPITATNADNDIEGALSDLTNMAFSSITANIWNALTSTMSTVGSMGLLLKTDIDTTISSRSTLTAAQVDTQLSGTHGPGAWGAGSGGAYAITIHATNGSTVIQGARVYLRNGSSLIGSGTTDVSGNTSGFSADNGTYTVTATASDYQNYSGSITVSGGGSFAVTMTADAALPAPSDPSQCTVGGYVRDLEGNALSGVTVTIKAVRESGSKPITASGAVVSLKTITLTTDGSGFASAAVDRTDSFDQDDVTYSITSSGGEMKSHGVTLESATKNFKDL